MFCTTRLTMILATALIADMTNMLQPAKFYATCLAVLFRDKLQEIPLSPPPPPPPRTNIFVLLHCLGDMPHQPTRFLY